MNYKTTLKEYAAEMAGNWTKFGSFGWHDKPASKTLAFRFKKAEDWTIIYTHNRDSDVLEQSNADVIKSEMEPFTEGDDPDAVSEHHGHWAVGWVDGFSIRVYKRGKITKAFEKMYELQKKLLDHPALDEGDFSEREFAEKQQIALDTIQYSTRELDKEGWEISDDAPDDWPEHVWGYIQEQAGRSKPLGHVKFGWERAQSLLEESGSTKDEALEAITESLRHLGWLTEV